MDKIMAVIAAILFIAGVVLFTIGQLNKDNEEEPETYKWMRIFAFFLILMAAACAIRGRTL